MKIRWLGVGFVNAGLIMATVSIVSLVFLVNGIQSGAAGTWNELGAAVAGLACGSVCSLFPLVLGIWVLFRTRR